MTQKILFVANIHKHFKAFHIPYIKYLQSKGFEVHVAANDDSTKIEVADKQYNIPIERTPLKINNIKAVRALKELIRKEEYCLIHCHTPIGALVTRLAAKEFRIEKKLKVVYTSHGFVFFKNSPKKFWYFYYPIEKYLSKFTDAIITINEEDYQNVLNKGFKNQFTYKVPGIGIGTEKFDNIDNTKKNHIRSKNSYQDADFLVLYVAEFIERKNHKFIIEAIPRITNKIKNIKFLFAGRGVLQPELEQLSRTLEADKFVDFLGFRKDIGEVIMMSDIGISASRYEGLPMNIAEEMYASKPVVISKVRGHVDLVKHGESGFLFENNNTDKFVHYIRELYENLEKRENMGRQAKIKSKKFELENSLKVMSNIYAQFLDLKTD
jgi:glycosyltransferase EpsD